MSIENLEAIEKSRELSVQVQTALTAAVQQVKHLWHTRTFSSGTFEDAAVVALQLELRFEKLHIANDEVLAAVENGKTYDFLARAQYVARCAVGLLESVAHVSKPRAIFRSVNKLITDYAKLAHAEPAEQSAAQRVAAPARGVELAPMRIKDQPRFIEWPLTESELSAPTRASLAAATLADERVLNAARQNRQFTAVASSALAPVTAPEWQALRSASAGIDPALEPRLQVALARHDSGSHTFALASTSADEIAVIAEVSDVARWEALSEVRVGVRVEPAPGSEGVAIVTGRIPVARIEHVRKQPFVLSLTSTRPVRPDLSATLTDMHVRPELLPEGVPHTGGEGVVVGIVDFGCDFAHQNFRHADGCTRIEALWVQAGPTVPGGALYGRLFTRSDIDAALQTPDPYQTLGYRPGVAAHGTHVMDIAAGNGRGTGVTGCAPDSTIVFVDLSATDINWDGPSVVGQSFGDSVRVIEAVDFIFAQAGARPCVVNLSLGTNGGPHDGTTPVEQGFDRLLAAQQNRAIVLAAGNAQVDHIHHTGAIPASGSVNLEWRIKSSPAGQEMEIWTQSGSRIAIEIIAPDGTSLGVTEPGKNTSVGTDTEVVLYVANQLQAPNGDNVIGIYLAGSVGKGNFAVRLLNRAGANVTYHAWIERSDSAQSFFANSVDSHTLGSISCGNETICVGSYDAHKPGRILSFFSSNGPTRDGRNKPEVSAPGHDVLAANSTAMTGLTIMSGTSMAAPAVSGLIALLLAEAQRQGKSLSSSAVRQKLIASVSHQAQIPQGGWHPGYGYGPVSTTVLSLI